LVQQEFGVMEEEDFEKVHAEAVVEFEALKQQKQKLEEEKQRESFMAQIEHKKGDK
jgi:hypothetical protein